MSVQCVQTVSTCSHFSLILTQHMFFVENREELIKAIQVAGTENVGYHIAYVFKLTSSIHIIFFLAFNFTQCFVCLIKILCRQSCGFTLHAYDNSPNIYPHWQCASRHNLSDGLPKQETGSL